MIVNTRYRQLGDTLRTGTWRLIFRQQHTETTCPAQTCTGVQSRL